MPQELDDLLCQRYPDIFIDRYTDPTICGMYWGFCCGDGWFDLIDSLCAVIASQVAAGISPPVVARQVKEKFGRLRFRFRGGNDETRRPVQYAEDRSEVTCESCGQPILRHLDNQRRQCAMCKVPGECPDAHRNVL